MPMPNMVTALKRLALTALIVLVGSAVIQAQTVFINEIHYDNTGTDIDEAIEIAGPAGTDLTGWRVVLYNGNGGASYDTINLSGTIPDQNNGFGTLSFLRAGIQNGAPDGLALVNDTDTVVQFLSYEGAFTAGGGPADGLLSSDIGVSENGSEPTGFSLQLTGTGSVYSDFGWNSPAAATFGAINNGQTFVGGNDTPPFVTQTSPIDGAIGVAVNTAITIAFSEFVTVTPNAFAIDCAAEIAFAQSGGPQTYTLTPVAFLPPFTTCTVTIVATEVEDQDGISLEADVTFSFTTETPFTCGTVATLIHAIQGAGMSSPLVDQVVDIEGVVVGAYQGAAGLRGFFVQEEEHDSDGDITTSEGLFVFDTLTTPVQAGDVVRVRGTVTEFNSGSSSLTELSEITNIAVCSSGQHVTPTLVALPVADLAEWERYEGMLLTIPQELTVTETFNLGSFGEVVLALGRLSNPTHIALPGEDALAVQDLNDRSRIILDDGSNLSRANFDPPPRLYPEGGLRADNTLRVGDRASSEAGHATLTAVLDQRFSAYRLHPVGPVTFRDANDQAANPRPEAPEAVGGTLRVASFNVLNYFTTLDTGSAICGPTGGLDCRGANSAEEFTRQRDKILSAIAALQAHVVGLIELENTPLAAIQDMVDGLNARLGADTYAFIDTGTIGTDAIRVGFLYQPAIVTPVGPFAILDNTVDLRAIDTQNRPALAQTFRHKRTREQVTVVVNHWKSKGSACATPTAPGEIVDPELGDGQGNCNLTRLSMAEALIDWLATDPTGSGDPRVLILGDLNAYAMEDPIQALVGARYTNMVQFFLHDEAYSFVFQGQSGYLDHALASPRLRALVTGVSEWHINADEPVALDYNTEWTASIDKNATQLDILYQPDPFRSSDHDPVLIGLNLLCGDLNDDNRVTHVDYRLFLEALGHRAGQPEYTHRADYDNNGRVNLLDQLAWMACYLRALR